PHHVGGPARAADRGPSRAPQPRPRQPAARAIDGPAVRDDPPRRRRRLRTQPRERPPSARHLRPLAPLAHHRPPRRGHVAGRRLRTPRRRLAPALGAASVRRIGMTDGPRTPGAAPASLRCPRRSALRPHPFAAAPTVIFTGTYVGFTRASNSDRNLFMIVRQAQLFPSARPQIVVPGIEPMLVAISSARSRSFVRPCPSSIFTSSW